MTAGSLVSAAGLALLGPRRPGDRYLTGVLPGIVALGLAMALIVVPLTLELIRSAEVADRFREGVRSTTTPASRSD